MKLRLLIVSAILAVGLGASGAPADPSKFEADFGILQKDGTCPEATHILKWPCPAAGQDFYLAFGKNLLPDVALLENTNVAIRGSLEETTCALPLVRVTKIRPSAILPPCVEPGTP